MNARVAGGGLFRHCPECAAPAAADNAGTLFACAACGFRLFFNPATAAGVFLEDPAGKVLLVRRAKAPAQGKLGIPGGFVDPGESAEEAVEREVMEEVGLAVEGLQFLCTFPNRYEFAGVLYHTVDLFFRAAIESFAAAAESAEVAQLVIANPADIAPAEIAFPSIRQAFALYAAVRGR